MEEFIQGFFGVILAVLIVAVILGAALVIDSLFVLAASAWVVTPLFNVPAVTYPQALGLALLHIIFSTHYTGKS